MPKKKENKEGRFFVKVKKLDPEAVYPQYQTPGSSGMDLVALTDQFLNKGQIRLVSTGLAFEIPTGYEGQIRPRSSLASRHGVTVVNSPGTIDSDYRGEVKVALINLSTESYKVTKGDRIAQLVIAPVMKAEIEAVTEVTDSERGEGGFGSTGQ